jgi:hypothetical protein
MLWSCDPAWARAQRSVLSSYAHGLHGTWQLPTSAYDVMGAVLTEHRTVCIHNIMFMTNSDQYWEMVERYAVLSPNVKTGHTVRMLTLC